MIEDTQGSVPDKIITPDEAHDFHYRHQQYLPMWTVYRPTTTDYPGQWLSRVTILLRDPQPRPVMQPYLMMARTLDEVRDMLPVGLTNIGRQPNDDPVIEEVWL